MKALLVELIEVTWDLIDLLIEKGKLPSSPLKQYRARKQAVVSLGSRLLTRAVLCRCPNKGDIRQWLRS
jgi:hypothetical protein